MLVQSASDATLTLVMAASGSEAAFVERMNREAKRLGMSKTHFMNATGLTEPGHESSARDLALLGRALVRDFPDRLGYFSQKELAIKGLTHYNGNRLLWRDSTVTGLKVGRTIQAGYCMAASAQRGAQRRMAVVLGARSDAQRTQEGLKLLNYGFENFDSVRLYRAQQPVKTTKLYRGARAAVSMGFVRGFLSADTTWCLQPCQGRSHHPATYRGTGQTRPAHGDPAADARWQGAGRLSAGRAA